MADRKHAKFAIVPALVGKIQRVSAKNLSRIFEIKPTLRKRDGALDRIEGDHLIICSYK